MFSHHDEDDSNKKGGDTMMIYNYDEDIENQQPSPHPMPPIILRKAFLHAPNTFKPVNHIDAMNKKSSTVLNFKTLFTAYVHVPKTQALSLKVF